MRQKLRPHLTFANVASALALFIAVSTGGAYATHLVVNSSDVVNESLLSQDIKGTNGTATTAAVNGSLTGADISGQAAKPAIGQPFVEGSLTGADVKDSSLTGADVNESSLPLGAGPWHAVGAPGQPPFGKTGIDIGNGQDACSWRNYPDTRHNSAGFLRDKFGFVHLKGLVDAEPDNGYCVTGAPPEWGVIFSLPPGFRPAKREVHVVLSNNAVGRVDVGGPAFDNLPAGAVSLGSSWDNARVWVSLDGISFRCAPSGQNGCP